MYRVLKLKIVTFVNLAKISILNPTLDLEIHKLIRIDVKRDLQAISRDSSADFGWLSLETAIWLTLHSPSRA